MNKVSLINKVIKKYIKESEINAWVCDDDAVEHIQERYKELTDTDMSELQVDYLRNNMSVDMYMNIQKGLKEVEEFLNI